jgi:phytoene synthase
MDLRTDLDKAWDRERRAHATLFNIRLLRISLPLALHAVSRGLVCIRAARLPIRQPNLAERRGLAFQLTNIIRDVKKMRPGARLFYSKTYKSAFLLPRCPPPHPPLSALLAMEAERAANLPDALFRIEEDSQPALWVLLTIYRRLLDKIESRQYDVFSGKVALSTREKLVILGKGFLKRLS